MREGQRCPHQHRDTERREQRVSEKETEAGYQEWGTEHTDPGKQTEGYRHQIQIWSDEVKVIPGHREPQQLAEQKRPRVVAGQAKGQERGRKVGASVGICLSIPRRRIGHLGAAAPERGPVPLGSAVRRAPRGLCIPMPAVCS